MFNLKKTLAKFLPINYFQSYVSYSQEGEDMVLRSFYEGKKNYKGFFVDVGAHHPYRFSNTLYFYKKGWRGINIEPTPGAIKAFNIFRRKDINLNIGISRLKDKLSFYCFNEPALNGFSKEISLERNNAATKYKIIKEVSIETWPLKDVFDTYLPKNQQIDFLTIDVEGFDLAVLQSNSWEKYRPMYIAVEDRMNLESLLESEVYSFLKKQGYQLVAKTLRTLFFKQIIDV
ncbi:FkbM family methyltransferase [Mucilaginibacter litoreus]|uniref:FkbM family methyltransferase n=1 Tax=Mucilaginibacter litoreus TaxID=1048221 RepID=A0ABW3AQD9_9SPHI